jgi:hypothetical protein
VFEIDWANDDSVAGVIVSFLRLLVDLLTGRLWI